MVSSASEVVGAATAIVSAPCGANTFPAEGDTRCGFTVIAFRRSQTILRSRKIASIRRLGLFDPDATPDWLMGRVLRWVQWTYTSKGQSITRREQ